MNGPLPAEQKFRENTAPDVTLTKGIRMDFKTTCYISGILVDNQYKMKANED